MNHIIFEFSARQIPEDEEAVADALDEEYTKNPPAPGPDGTGAWTKFIQKEIAAAS